MKQTWLDIASIVLRKQYVMSNPLPWLHKIASSLSLPVGMEINDLISYGMEGLQQANNKFDPTRGIQFTTYAEHRIIGAMLDGIRNQWSAVNCRRGGEVFFSELTNDEPDPRSDDPDTDILIDEIFQIVETLPKFEAEVIKSVFFDGLTQRATAKALLCSPAWVSVVKIRAIDRIKLRLKQMRIP